MASLCRKRLHDLDNPENIIMHSGRRRCRHCTKVSRDRWRNSNADKYRKSVKRGVWKHYGLDPDQAETLWKNRSSCEICNLDKDDVKLCVDHNHETGTVRGILCKSCNVLLGYARDNTKILKQAIQYLENKDGDN